MNKSATAAFELDQFENAENYARKALDLQPNYGKDIAVGSTSVKYILPFVAAGGDPSIPQDILSVKAEYLRATFDQVKTQCGSIEDYFDKGRGIDRAGQQKLRDRFLQT